MFRVRRNEPFETGDLNVFVPGLMAAGILVSMAMLIADGRVSDLESIGLGMAPVPKRIERIPRSAITSSALAFVSSTAAHGIARTTIGSYTARTGELAGRGWTLSIGLGLAGTFAIFGAVALMLALTRGRTHRPWLLIAARRWPLGQLPHPTQEEAA